MRSLLVCWVTLKLYFSSQEIAPAARDVFLDSADALIESDGARESLASALAALSGIKNSQRSLLTGAEKSTTLMVTSRSGFRSKSENCSAAGCRCHWGTFFSPRCVRFTMCAS